MAKGKSFLEILYFIYNIYFVFSRSEFTAAYSFLFEEGWHWTFLYYIWVVLSLFAVSYNIISIIVWHVVAFLRKFPQQPFSLLTKQSLFIVINRKRHTDWTHSCNLFCLFSFDSMFTCFTVMCSVSFILYVYPSGIVEQPPPVQGNTNRRSVSTLRPSAKDAYMLFQVMPQRGGSWPPVSNNTNGLRQL